MEARTLRRSISMGSFSELPNESLQRIAKNLNASERGKFIRTNSEIMKAIDKKIHVDYALSRNIFEQITALASSKHSLTDEQFDKLLHHENPEVHKSLVSSPRELTEEQFDKFLLYKNREVIEKLCLNDDILTPIRIDKILNMDNLNAHRAIAQNNYPLTSEQFNKLITDEISSNYIAASHRVLSEQQVDQLAGHRSPIVIEKLIFSLHPLTEKNIDDFINDRNYLKPLYLARSNRTLTNKQFKALITHREGVVRRVFTSDVLSSQFVERKLTRKEKSILLAHQFKKSITFGILK